MESVWDWRGTEVALHPHTAGSAEALLPAQIPLGGQRLTAGVHCGGRVQPGNKQAVRLTPLTFLSRGRAGFVC